MPITISGDTPNFTSATITTGTITNLTTTTISNGTVSTSSANVIQGSAKAWVNFNGTGTVAIRASYNVSSITDNGTGDYTVNFTNALADANYSVMGANTGIITGTNPTQFCIAAAGAGSAPTLMSTTQVRIVFPSAGTGADVNTASVAVFR